MDKMSKGVALLSLLDDKARDKDAVFLCEDEKQQDRVLSAEDSIFLQEFPTIKRELEVAIQENLALVDEIDRFAKTQVVTSSVAVASSVMSILALALAPVTLGGSLVLSAAGTGVAVAAGILTKILEHRHNERVQAQVSRQVSTCDQEVWQPLDKLDSYVTTLHNQGKNIKSIQKNIDALQIARVQPRLAFAAKRRLTTGQVSDRRARQVQKAFGGTTTVLKRSTDLLGTARAGLSLGMELHFLINEVKHPKEGAKAMYAEVLRAHTKVQKRELAELTQHYESLRQKEERLLEEEWLLQEERLLVEELLLQEERLLEEEWLLQEEERFLQEKRLLQEEERFLQEKRLLQEEERFLQEEGSCRKKKGYCRKKKGYCRKKKGSCRKKASGALP